MRTCGRRIRAQPGGISCLRMARDGSGAHIQANPSTTDGVSLPVLRQLYRSVLRIRRVEERLAALYPEQQMRCPVHLCIGQEAVAAGVCLNLRPQDSILSSHRSHGHYLAHGGSLAKMMAEIYGKATGCSRGRGGSMHLIDREAGFLGATPIVGSTMAIGVGVAFAAAMRKEDRVIVVFFGDGATEEGIFHESLSFAVLQNLPILFVCENNLYSVYSPLSVRQSDRHDLLGVVRAHGVHAEAGDGNDAEEVFRLARNAVECIRVGQGPRFLTFDTYRWLEHCGPNDDDNLGYRPPGELASWKQRCPLRLLEQRLEVAGMPVEEREADEACLDAEIQAAVEFARESPFPTGDQLFEGITAL